MVNVISFVLVVLFSLYSQEKQLRPAYHKERRKEKCNKLVSLFIPRQCVPIIERGAFICIFLYFAVAHVGAEHPESV